MPNLVISLAHTGGLAKAFAGRRHRGKLCSVNSWMALAVPNDVCRWQILLKKSLMISGSSDSVAVMRFAVEAGDDGAARSRSRAAVLFILS